MKQLQLHECNIHDRNYTDDYRWTTGLYMDMNQWCLRGKWCMHVAYSGEQVIFNDL